MRWTDAKPLQGQYRRYGDSVTWRVVRSSYALYGGVEVRQLNGSGGMAATSLLFAASIVSTYLTELNNACTAYDVPIELLLTAMQTSGAYVYDAPTDVSNWQPTYTATLDGYVDDETTPDKIYVGLTGILLSEAQIMDASLTAGDLHDVQTNFNACAMSMAYRSGTTKFDPIFVAAHYNQRAIRDNHDVNDGWRMLGFRDDPDNPVWFNAWATSFTTAVAAYPDYLGVTAPSFGDMIYDWVEEPPAVVFSDSLFMPAANAAIAAGLTMNSTLSPQLNVVWTLSQETLSVMCAAAMDAFNGFGPLIYTFDDQAGTAVSMSRTELGRLYAALANFCFNIIIWDSKKHAGFPDAFNPFPATTVTIP